MSGVHEWSAVPGKVLGTTIDKLLMERADLEDRRGEAFLALEAAESLVGPAKRKDIEAHARALRSKNATDPGRKHEDAANAEVEKTQRTLEGLRTATDQNQADLLDYLSQNEDKLITDLRARQQEVRSTALASLGALSTQLVEFAQLQGLVSLVMAPTKGDSLRRWAPDALRVEIVSPDGSKMPAQRAIDLIGQRLERGSPGVELRVAATEAWPDMHHFDTVERLDTGPLKTNKLDIWSIKAVGLVRYSFVRRVNGSRRVVDLVVCVASDVMTNPTQLFRENASAIETAFDNGARFVVADGRTQDVLDRAGLKQLGSRDGEREGVAEAARDARKAREAVNVVELFPDTDPDLVAA